MKVLEGKKALITGGTSGIGEAIAIEFAKQGAQVAIMGTNEEKGKQVLDRLTSLSEGHLFLPVDVSNKDSVHSSITQVYNQFQTLDILVNNAGITRDGLFMSMKEEDWDSVMDVNLKAVFHLCQGVVRPMIKARKGKIINISSVIGLIGNAGQTNYAASKAGLIAFSKSLAKELAPRNICVNCIAPGFIQTAMTEKLTEKQQEGILSLIPMRKMGQPEDIAQAALFLASSASDYVTGQVLTVDGGMVM